MGSPPFIDFVALRSGNIGVFFLQNKSKKGEFSFKFFRLKITFSVQIVIESILFQSCHVFNKKNESCNIY